MNYTERAKQLGFSAAAVMDTKNLVFKPEYRVFCEENRCGNYDRNGRNERKSIILQQNTCLTDNAKQ